MQKSRHAFADLINTSKQIKKCYIFIMIVVQLQKGNTNMGTIHITRGKISRM